MGPGKHLRAIRLLQALSSPRSVPPVRIEQTAALGGFTVDRYARDPRPKRQIVLLHGLTPRGARDGRLVRLARVLAREGVDCWVPELPGLSSFAMNRGDLECIDCAAERAAQDGTGTVAVMGFSLGGGYGLVAASRPRAASLVEHVTAMGAHHDLGEVWRAIHATGCGILERLDAATESELYCALACARRSLSESTLGAELSGTLDAALRGYCEHADLVAVRQLIRDQLSKYWSRLESDPACEDTVELSPAGKLVRLRARVTLMHAPDDDLVPLCHAERNFSELARRDSGDQSLLVTRLLDHVRPRVSESWRDIPTLVDCFARLL